MRALHKCQFRPNQLTRSAFFRDYCVAFPSDCSASFDESMHQATLKTLDMFFGRVVSTDERLDEMGGVNAPRSAAPEQAGA